MTIKKTNHLLFAVFFVIFLAAVTLPGSARAADNDDESNTELTVARFIKERNAAMRELSKLKISAAAGFSGHEAGENNLYQLGLGVGVTKEMYPGEFQFHTSTSLVIQDSKLQENVTTLKLSYEHYLAPWLETYGFLERFANTFLGLQYRYEIGGGFKAEYNVKPGKWENISDTSARTFEKYRRLLNDLEHLAKKNADAGDEEAAAHIAALSAQLAHLEKQETGIMEAARRDHSLLSLGMAVSLFAELEKPANAVILDPAEALNEQEKFRFVLRPSFVFRPSNLIALSGYYYYKYPLFKRENPNDPLQYRTDMIFRAALNLAGDASWTKSAALVFEYRRHFDNNPFGVFNIVNRSNVDASKVNTSHDIFLIQLNFEF